LHGPGPAVVTGSRFDALLVSAVSSNHRSSCRCGFAPRPGPSHEAVSLHRLSRSSISRWQNQLTSRAGYGPATPRSPGPHRVDNEGSDGHIYPCAVLVVRLPSVAVETI